MVIESTENGLQAVATVRRFLTEMEFPFVEQQLANGFAFLVPLDGPAEQGVAQVLSDSERFVFHLIFPGYVAEERRLQVAEFITRINWRLIEGGFQLDFCSGALRYKAGIDFTGTELTTILVRNAILAGIEVIDMVVAALTAVTDGRLDPAAAYNMIDFNDENCSHS